MNTCSSVGLQELLIILSIFTLGVGLLFNLLPKNKPLTTTYKRKRRVS